MPPPLSLSLSLSQTIASREKSHLKSKKPRPCYTINVQQYITVMWTRVPYTPYAQGYVSNHLCNKWCRNILQK